MMFVAFEQAFTSAIDRGWLDCSPQLVFYLYPVKILVVAGLLLSYRGHYSEISLKDLSRYSTSFLSIASGLLVFVLWIRMDWTLSSAHGPRGYNLLLLNEGSMRVILGGFRVVGATIVVPIMEELFWRSFLMRYISDRKFDSVPIGTFSLPSFLITVLLFGVEHDYLVAGMMAGVIYNLLIYKTRSVAQCILAHMVTNASLAWYVLAAGRWDYW